MQGRAAEGVQGNEGEVVAVLKQGLPDSNTNQLIMPCGDSLCNPGEGSKWGRVQ